MTNPAPILALTRFGYGARPGDLASVGPDPKAWLLAPFRSPEAFALTGDRLVGSKEAIVRFRDYNEERLRQQRGEAGQGEDAMRAIVRSLARLGMETAAVDVEARTTRALSVPNTFPERWVRFWSNWFTVSAIKAQTIALAGPFEREAIRPNVRGRFEDLLVAAVRHPAMLVYLDQFQSVGPNSVFARGRRREVGLNENLAREILELHTVGTEAGYTQTDVTEFARAMTGLTLVNDRILRFFPDAELGEAVFIRQMHEPGARTVLGRTYADTGEDQAVAILRDLARHPAVPRRVAQRVAAHFVADDPPKTLVDRLEATFKRTNGDLAALAGTLVDSPEAWNPTLAKFKTPEDFLLSSLRASDVRQVPIGQLRPTFEQLGQAPYRAPSPKGWPDDAASWAGPDAIMKRADYANVLAGRLGDSVNPVSFAENALGPLLTDHTRTALRRAESGRQGLVLAMMSPEFQRR